MKRKPVPKPSAAQRKPPVRIPLPFDTAVEGLLAIKPSAKKKPAVRKAASRKKK
jgi:hypothetical protein